MDLTYVQGVTLNQITLHIYYAVKFSAISLTEKFRVISTTDGNYLLVLCERKAQGN